MRANNAQLKVMASHNNKGISLVHMFSGGGT